MRDLENTSTCSLVAFTCEVNVTIEKFRNCPAKVKNKPNLDTLLIESGAFLFEVETEILEQEDGAFGWVGARRLNSGSDTVLKEGNLAIRKYMQ